MSHSEPKPEMTVNDIVKQIMEEHGELLDRLGSDYDSDGVPYWEKWPKKDGSFDWHNKNMWDEDLKND